MQKHVFDMTNSRGGLGFDRQLFAPFQTIIEKGKQAKAQDENDQYEARKAKKETEIKNAARIRHAESEASRRRAEESKLSVDDHKGKVLDEMTKNVRAILENQYREEIREKVYEDEDKIVSAHERDIKDQTKARLVRELESVVKAKLGAEFELEVKQQLAVELKSVVKAELRASYETEVKQQLFKELEPEVEAVLRAKHETEIKQQLAKELQSVVKAELRAKYEEEIKNQLMIELRPTIVHKLRVMQTSGVEDGTQVQHEALHVPNEETFRATPNHIDSEGGEYPDLSHHHHLNNQNGVQNGRQEAGSVQTGEAAKVDEVAVDMAHGTKRFLSEEGDAEEVPYARHSKRFRSASFNSEEQQSRNAYEGEISNPHSSYAHGQQAHQGVRYNREEFQDLLQYKGDASYENAQVINGCRLKRGTVGYNSSDEVPGSNGNIVDRGGLDYNSAEDVQGVNGDFSDCEEAEYDSTEDFQGANRSLLGHQEAYYDSAEDVQEVNGNFLDREVADYDSAEDIQGINGNFLDLEEADYDSAEDVQGSNGYKLDGEATEFSEEDEDEDEEDEEDEPYEGEEEEQFSTAPQVAPHSSAGNGVIAFSNTQDTAFVLSDSEDDEDKADDEDETLVGYEGPPPLDDAKDYKVHVEESLFLDAGGA